MFERPNHQWNEAVLSIGPETNAKASCLLSSLLSHTQ